MKATIYLPGQPARSLTAAEVATLNIRLVPSAHTEDEEMLTADDVVVSRLLKVLFSDLILATPTACAFGLENALDHHQHPHPDAESDLIRLFGYAEVVGPLLIIENTPTVPQPSPATDMAATVADFMSEVRAACAEAGTPEPKFVGHHRPGDEVLYK